MRRAATLLALLVLSALAPRALRARERTITLQEALRVGRDKGRNVREITASYARERARFAEVRSDYTPEVTVWGMDDGTRSASVTKRLKKSGSLTASTLGYDPGEGTDTESVTWQHPLFRTNDRALDEAEVDFHIARLKRTHSLVNYRFSVISRFFEVVRLQERVKVNANAVERWRKLLEFAKARFQLGTSTKIDVLNTEVNLGGAENDLLREEQNLASARDGLADFIGLAPSTRLLAREAIAFEKLEIERSKSWSREDLEIFALELKAARIRARDDRRDARPDVTWTSAWSDMEGAPSDFTHTLAWTFSLGKRPDEWAYVGSREAQRLSAIALERKRAAVLLEQRDVKRRLERLERSIRIAEANVGQAEESLEASQFSFEKGLISAIELREAQDKLTQAKSSLVNLLIDYRIAGYDYERLLGGDLE